MLHVIIYFNKLKWRDSYSSSCEMALLFPQGSLLNGRVVSLWCYPRVSILSDQFSPLIGLLFMYIAWGVGKPQPALEAVFKLMSSRYTIKPEISCWFMGHLYLVSTTKSTSLPNYWTLHFYSLTSSIPSYLSVHCTASPCLSIYMTRSHLYASVRFESCVSEDLA